MAMSFTTHKTGSLFVKTRDEVFRNLARGSFDEEEFSRAPDDDGYCYLILYEPGLMRARAAHHLGPYPTWRSIKRVGVPKTSSSFCVRERQGYVHVSPSMIGHRLQDLVIDDDSRMGSASLVSEGFASWLSNVSLLLCCIYMPGYTVLLAPFVASAICMTVYLGVDVFMWLRSKLTLPRPWVLVGKLDCALSGGSLGFATSVMGMLMVVGMGALGVEATSLVGGSTPLNSNFDTFGPVYDWNDAFDVAFDYIIPSTLRLCISDDEVRNTILALDIDHGKEEFFRHICPRLGVGTVWLEDGLIDARRYFRRKSGGIMKSSFERAREDFRKAMGSIASTTVDVIETVGEEVSKIDVMGAYETVRDEVYDTGAEVFKDSYTPKDVIKVIKARGKEVMERSHGLDDVADLAFGTARLGGDIATELLSDGGMVVGDTYLAARAVVGSTGSALQDYAKTMVEDISAGDASRKTKEVLTGILCRAEKIIGVGDDIANKIVNTDWRAEGVNAVENAPWATNRMGSTFGGFLSGFAESVGINLTDLVFMPSVSNVKGLRKAFVGDLPESFGKWWSTDFGYRKAPLFAWKGGYGPADETGSLMTAFVAVIGMLGIALIFNK